STALPRSWTTLRATAREKRMSDLLVMLLAFTRIRLEVNLQLKASPRRFLRSLFTKRPNRARPFGSVHLFHAILRHRLEATLATSAKIFTTPFSVISLSLKA